MKIFEELINFQNKIKAEFTNNGLYVNITDSTNTILFDLYYHKDEFLNYSIEGKQHLVLGLDLEELSRSLKCSHKEANIIFNYSSQNGDFFYVTTAQETDMYIKHKLRLLEIQSISLDIPDTEYAIIFRYNFKDLYGIVNKLMGKHATYFLISKLIGDKFLLYLKADNSNSYKFEFSTNYYTIDKEIINLDNYDNSKFNDNIQ